MLERLLNAVRRQPDQPPSMQLRPNELRREVVRAERRRREALRGEAAPNRYERSLEEQRPRRQPEAPAVLSQAPTEPWQATVLKSRSGLRQALLLKEILDPPLAFREHRYRERDH